MHLETFPEIDPAWRNDELARRSGSTCARVRRVVTGALELERADKRIGSSLEAAPDVYVADNGHAARARRRRPRRGVDHQRRPAHRQGAARGRLHAARRAGRRRRAQARRRAESARAPGASSPTSAPIRSSPICRRAMPPPCASSISARRKARRHDATPRRPAAWLWGPYSRLGLAVGARHARARPGAQVVDARRLRHRRARPRRRRPPSSTSSTSRTSASATASSTRTATRASSCWRPSGCVATCALWVWLARGGANRLMAVSLGLIMGGALGNAIDRVRLGRGCGLLLPARLGLLLVRVQHRRRGHCCRGRGAAV